MDLWVDANSDAAVMEKGPVLEAALGRDLAHPNVIATYEYAVRREQVRRAAVGACVLHAGEGVLPQCACKPARRVPSTTTHTSACSPPPTTLTPSLSVRAAACQPRVLQRQEAPASVDHSAGGLGA